MPGRAARATTGFAAMPSTVTSKSRVAFIDAAEEEDAFYGYSAPGHTEEFWILDIEGARLMIEANWSPDSPRRDVAEMRAILDTLRIEP